MTYRLELDVLCSLRNNTVSGEGKGGGGHGRKGWASIAVPKDAQGILRLVYTLSLACEAVPYCSEFLIPLDNGALFYMKGDEKNGFGVATPENICLKFSGFHVRIVFSWVAEYLMGCLLIQ